MGQLINPLVSVAMYVVSGARVPLPLKDVCPAVALPVD